MKKIACFFIVVMLIASVSVAQTPLTYRDTTIKGPQTFAIILGISKYKYVRPLSYADKDAELFRDYLKSPGGGSVRDNNIFCLLNENANSFNFWSKGFQWLKAKNLQRGDKLFIYLAGHGDAIDEDQFFFLGYDCNPQGDKNNYLVAGTIQLYNLKKKISDQTSKGVEVIFVMDACRTSELPGGVEGQNFLNTAISEKQAGEIIMLATAAGEESLEDISIGNGHGLFTYYLVDGLTGSADSIGTLDNKVTFDEIRKYVDKNVPAVAAQRFNRKQDPYFCCDEINSRIISSVDTAYLKKWLKTKKAQQRGPGNSFDGISDLHLQNFEADTTLLQAYDLFNKAVGRSKITGSASAEYFYQQMNSKYPGTPYTLDAKSTLAVEFIKDAQQKVDRYLACGDDGSAKEKQANYDAAVRLQKAIDLVSEDDPDYAKTLMNRVYFLKASGDYGVNGRDGDISIAFQNAWAALKINPNGAYIQNKLAQLHLQNNNKDSALYYANQAVKNAPKWACALTTLALLQQATTSNHNQPKKKINNKFGIGATLGGGLTRSNPTYSGDANTGVFAVDSRSAAMLDAGLIGYIRLGRTVAIRPGAVFMLGNTDILLDRRGATGAPITEQFHIKNNTVNISLPFIINFSDKKNISPYFTGGVTYSIIINQDEASTSLLPLKKSLFMGDLGLGLDFLFPKSGMVLSPELKYSAGFSDMADRTVTTQYNVAISSLKKNVFSLNLYLRKK